MEQSVEIVDKAAMKRALTRMTYELIERNKGIQDVVIVGIKTRGAWLGQRMVDRIKELEGVEVPFVELETKAYRDDQVVQMADRQALHESIGQDFTGKHIFLVDDVLYTGRTIRAAMDAIMDNGRPQRISLVVLVDRGHRELPIRPDIIGKNIPTSRHEKVIVHLEEIDGEDRVVLHKPE